MVELELTFVEDQSSSDSVDGDGASVDRDGGASADDDADSLHGGTGNDDTKTKDGDQQPPLPTPARSRRYCRDNCADWWRSSAGGKSGIANIFLAIFIILYAAFIALSREVGSLLIEIDATPFFQMTLGGIVVVGGTSGVLILFTLWVLRRITCARRGTLKEFEETANERRHSKWRVVQVFECVKEAKGPGSAIWAEITLAKEVVETGLQIINIANYAGSGYSATALYIYLAIIALNAVVWWMLTLPRTVRTVRGILVLNALISTFYGTFAVAYLMVDGVAGIMMQGDSDFKVLDLDRLRLSDLVRGAATEALFGGTPAKTTWKLLTRMVPLFVAVSTIEDLATLEYYFKDGVEDQHEQDGGARTEDATPSPSSTSSSSKVNNAAEQSKASLLAARLNHRIMSRSKEHHRGLKKRVVLPAIAAVLALVLAMTTRLVVLSGACQYAPPPPGNIIRSQENTPQQQHWMEQWCLRQAFPLLTTLPGSRPECACALLIVRPVSNQTACDATALTQLHDDLVNEDRHIAKYLRNMIHDCAMQNTTQTEQILGAKMESIASIDMRTTTSSRTGSEEGGGDGGGNDGHSSRSSN